MVATKLHEVTNKGIDWAYGSGPGTPSKMNLDPSPHAEDDEGYFSYATNSLWSAYDQTQSTLSGLVSSLYTGSSSSAVAGDIEQSIDLSAVPASDGLDKREWRRKASSIKLKYPELEWLLKNPYSNARGVHDRPSPMSDVRSLLVHVHNMPDVETQGVGLAEPRLLPPISAVPKSGELIREQSISSLPEETVRHRNSQVKSVETAQKLAEGSIRALRDLTLIEASELHHALNYWTLRWERPLLSWVEAGPWVWFSEEGYNHQLIGQKVSQIQAVLARRCASVGELQQHLLRAGWRKGVAQWGVLGQGEQWAQIAGGDGTMNDASPAKGKRSSKDAPSFTSEADFTKLAAHRFRRRSLLIGGTADEKDLLSSNIEDENEQEEQIHSAYYGDTNMQVKNTRGGEIVKDDPALAAWSVDAMRLVRGVLYGAMGRSNPSPLPFACNWARDDDVREEYAPSLPKTDIDSVKSKSNDDDVSLPAWATYTASGTLTDEESVDSVESSRKAENREVRISDLPLMASEVSELLNSMEVILEKQRNRRRDRLRPLSRFRRNWYMMGGGIPIVTYIFQSLLEDGKGMLLAKEILQKVSSFYYEHVSGPLRAVFYELFTRQDRETISDRQARMDAIASCKNMIRSWLDETYPEMDEAERQTRADKMDFSLIERKKEESIKTIFEINSVVRMSLIEIQFIKKELMNALYAMDEMMSSNEININLAAVTPALLVLYTAKHTFRVLFYALFKLGRSREETYASFRQVILDIERLLVMRDNPPMAPPPLGGRQDNQTLYPSQTTIVNGDSTNRSVLSADDLGMLVLHIHECRTILWRDRRRFSKDVRRNMSEDLAELAGERGAVSVQQQLQIIERMCRTYPFLKAFGSGFHLGESILP